MPPQPSPKHILRTHSSAVNCLFVSSDNKRIISGDVSGQVVITSTSTLRSLASWQAHTDAVFGVEELGMQIITHGRDHKLHVWKRPEASNGLRNGAANTSNAEPILCYSMDVNALNFCRFSLLPLSGDRSLIALPNLVESSEADVWALPDVDRIHAAVGRADKALKTSLGDGRGTDQLAAGIIMSMHLFEVDKESSTSKELRLLSAYESGGVALRAYARTDKIKSVEGKGWDTIWMVRRHVEAIMAMRVYRNLETALTVSSDHLIGKYQLQVPYSFEDPDSVSSEFATKKPGNACIAVRDDGKVCAVGSWQGHVHLYSTKTFKSLGSLRYHRESCQAIEFARSEPSAEQDDLEEEDSAAPQERLKWLVVGSKDGRITIWELMTFSKDS